ncbi:hypothetical protein J6TS1_19930 [Siminovitchia terrae]|uniref:MotA/TolQ/ExbB proton channel domain-containing protein n=1 Tax=Siminovitchia terrae TaxID=1914933 RepID=A0ABQ4KVR5_SIMTE|nr:hypothetical protein [Siminovitchia terrae]GIN96123.1 hypothetical protein J6TS1_19930 [Siminovitchia terrae]
MSKRNKTKIIIYLVIYASFWFVAFRLDSKLIFGFLIVITTIFSLMGLLIFALRLLGKDLKKEKPDSNGSLYDWTSNIAGAHNLINFLLKDENSTSDIMRNIMVIKDRLENYCENDITKLRLLKAYFEAVSSNKTKSLYFKTIMTVFIGGVLASFRIRSQSDNELLIMFFNIKMDSIMDLFIIFISVLLMIIFFLDGMTVGKNRINLICNILEQCIEEREKIKSPNNK